MLLTWWRKNSSSGLPRRRETYNIQVILVDQPRCLPRSNLNFLDRQLVDAVALQEEVLINAPRSLATTSIFYCSALEMSLFTLVRFRVNRKTSLLRTILIANQAPSFLQD